MSAFLFGDEDEQDVCKVITGKDAVPDVKAPKPVALQSVSSITKAKLAVVRRDEELQRLLRQQAKVKDKVVQKYGFISRAPSDLQERYTASSRAYHRRLTCLLEQAFVEEREQYFHRKHHTVGDHGAVASKTSASHGAETEVNTDFKEDGSDLDLALVDVVSAPNPFLLR